ncbi:MAG: pyrroline-5-carboxylate reductase [candidate division FCPU426 bacterium]
MIPQTIGFVGAGNMAEALIRGLLSTRSCRVEQLAASDVNEIRLAYMTKNYKVTGCAHNRELAGACDILVLAVKPQQIREVLADLSSSLRPERHILVSIAAGITTTYIEKAAAAPVKVVRAMPNTPARLLAGATAFCLGQYAGEAESLLAHMLFDAVGLTFRVEEDLLNTVTAVSGSGPAYVFKFCEMLIRAGVDMGLPSADAEQLAIQTIWGAAKMLKETQEPPAALRAAVTSPGGTTQAALEHLAASDFETVFLQALAAARNRAEALSLQRD